MDPMRGVRGIWRSEEVGLDGLDSGWDVIVETMRDGKWYYWRVRILHDNHQLLGSGRICPLR